MCAPKAPTPKAPPKPPTERDNAGSARMEAQARARRASQMGGYESTLGGTESRPGTSPTLGGSTT